ncbi:unnamed protein product [Cuscuta campestris]|uniref:Inositol polyphosphate-related phosphatase domain-containing protein n=1 Tax=Cuscuta campestris TaxID=132261 RepID=A0A484L2S7_9ASTE|nr:unnamed protein product [Cuscuta campestris]
MDSWIDDDDGDFFSPFTAATVATNTTSAGEHGKFHANSQNFIFSPPPPLVSPDSEDGSDCSHSTYLSFNLDENQRTPKIFDRFYDSSSDDDKDEEFTRQNDAAQKRLDYMIQFLDRKLSSSLDSASFNSRNNSSINQPLPEFVGQGGGRGIFKLQDQAGTHPGRPPSLELRPHPLIETQFGRFLRTIICTGDQLWAGSETGVRVWNLADIYGVAPDENLENGAAPFFESVETPPTLCLVGDAGNRVVWSGHKDGRIRCWKMDNACGSLGDFSEVLSWQAHSGPVLSMVITSYGDLWSGSECGAIKVWTWEAIEKSFSLTAEEHHMASLLIERSYVDIKNQGTLNGNNIFSADVRYMVSDRSGAKVWTAGYLSFALWDARVWELLKVFNIDGQVESISAVQDPVMEEELRMKSVYVSKKEKSQTSFSFFQRSCNAILGAADAVRRVAAKGGFGDDNRRTEALVIMIDEMIWTGCANGLLVQWDSDGNHVHEVQYHTSSVQCFCTFGSRIWVGYASGIVQVLDINGKSLGEWLAHGSPIIEMAVADGYVFTLANHGGIRGWSILSPAPIDDLLHSELAERDFLYTRIEDLKVLAGTWNVAQGRASHDSLITWLGFAAAEVGIVVVGLQEVEMGAGFLAMSAAKETMQVGLEVSSTAQWWMDMIGKTLDEGSTFVCVGSRQLAGLLIGVWVRRNISRHVGDVEVAAVPCGFGHAIGNKGAVGLRMRVYGRVLCFVNCHFAAHLEAVGRRNSDFDHVYRGMVFSRPSSFPNAAAASVSSVVQMLRGSNGAVNSLEAIPELSEADMVVFLGDFNYRLDGISYDEARDFISQRSFDWLRERDQLHKEMKAGNVFQGMREAVIKFPPTYKFEKHQPGLAGYDSGEKKRIPAWCDRILYRDCRTSSVSTCSLDCPVVSSVLQYEACMDVTDSDHKPVRCIFSVQIARIDESVRRQEYGEIMRCNEKIKSLLKEGFEVPDAIVSTNNIILQNMDASILRITNKCGKGIAMFDIICEGETTVRDDGQAFDHRPRGSFGFPRWLEVSPVTGIIEPDQITEVIVHHKDYQTVEEFVDGVPRNCWCEDARDKEVILVVHIRGGCTTEMRCHRIRVRHCFLGIKIAPQSNSNRSSGDSNNNLFRADVLHRADIQHLSFSSDVFEQLKSIQSP